MGFHQKSSKSKVSDEIHGPTPMHSPIYWIIDGGEIIGGKEDEKNLNCEDLPLARHVMVDGPLIRHCLFLSLPWHTNRYFRMALDSHHIAGGGSTNDNWSTFCSCCHLWQTVQSMVTCDRSGRTCVNQHHSLWHGNETNFTCACCLLVDKCPCIFVIAYVQRGCFTSPIHKGTFSAVGISILNKSEVPA